MVPEEVISIVIWLHNLNYEAIPRSSSTCQLVRTRNVLGQIGSRFIINGILLHDALSKLYFCEGTRKKRNGAITSPFGPIINLTNW